MDTSILKVKAFNVKQRAILVAMAGKKPMTLSTLVKRLEKQGISAKATLKLVEGLIAANMVEVNDGDTDTVYSLTPNGQLLGVNLKAV